MTPSNHNHYLADIILPSGMKSLEDIVAAQRVLFWSVDEADWTQPFDIAHLLDAMILNLQGVWGDIRVANTANRDFDHLIPTLHPTPELVRQLYSQGFTIILNDLQDKNLPIFWLCQELESALAAHVNCNAYMTPSNAQGLNKHYDDQDVLVVQIEGEKTWKVYPPKVEINPCVGVNYEQSFVESCLEFTSYKLSVGSVLYIPKGFPHEAYSSAHVGSTHLTFSIQTPCVNDLFQKMIQSLFENTMDSCQLRTRVSTAVLKNGESDPKFQQDLLFLAEQLMIQMKDDALIKEAISRFLAAYSQQKKNILINNTDGALSCITMDAQLRAHPAQAFFYSPTACKMYFKGGSIDIDTGDYFIVELLQCGAIFKVSALPGTTNEEKINCARSLISNHLVYVCKDCGG